MPDACQAKLSNNCLEILLACPAQVRPCCAFTHQEAARNQLPSGSDYSMRNACMGSMLAARRAGMNPAKAAASESTSTAIEILKGS